MAHLLPVLLNAIMIKLKLFAAPYGQKRTALRTFSPYFRDIVT
jgi:hypothetical protein